LLMLKYFIAHALILHCSCSNTIISIFVFRFFQLTRSIFPHIHTPSACCVLLLSSILICPLSHIYKNWQATITSWQSHTVSIFHGPYSVNISQPIQCQYFHDPYSVNILWPLYSVNISRPIQCQYFHDPYSVNILWPLYSVNISQPIQCQYFTAHTVSIFLRPIQCQYFHDPYSVNISQPLQCQYFYDPYSVNISQLMQCQYVTAHTVSIFHSPYSVNIFTTHTVSIFHSPYSVNMSQPMQCQYFTFTLNFVMGVFPLFNQAMSLLWW